ncbi:MAG: MdtA/MuxA family multidrug efflux RND transporter periplasmic adaptor subunit [Methyloceanibacter sp.]|jgi:membrane fusion protein, multidrug efflux system
MNQELQPAQKALPGIVQPVSKRAPRTLKALFFILVLELLLVAVLWSQQEPSQQSPGDRRNAGQMSIGSAKVENGNIGVTLTELGTVTSLATVTIRTQISGYLIRIDFTEGQDVKKNDLLAEIDPRPYEAALALAKGNLARDEALLQGAQVDLERYQKLATQNAVPRQTLEDQVATVAQDQGTLVADRAAVQAAEVNLAYTRIISPLDGRVGLRLVDQGNYVTPGDTNGLVVITQIQPITVIFTIPEDNLPAVLSRLRDGATLPVAIYDRSDTNKLADGELHAVDSQIDPTTGTIKLRAQFANDARTLFPNQFVNVRLLVDTHKDVTVMPTAAIQRGAPGTFVYMVNSDNTVSVRPVVLGVTDGNRVEVRSGLAPGDLVVVDGADKLRDGAKISMGTEADGSKSSEPTKSTQPDQSNGKQRHHNHGSTQ